MKEIIDALERKYGSLRKAAEVLGTSHQNLMNWRRGQNGDFLDLLEKTRKALGVSKKDMWSKIRGEK